MNARFLLSIGAITFTFIAVGSIMLNSSFYIPEARQPVGFPKPGKVDEIVVKSYPEYRSARVSKPATDEGGMFGALFNHIKTNNISMTAPVEMTFGDSGTNSMAFLYRNREIGETGPDGPVQVVDHPAVTVVSVAVRGKYSKQRFDDCTGRLERWLADNDQWTACGNPRYLAFNSPFVPGFLRYGEVQIPVEAKN
jgi:hypothetical protein